MEEKRHPRHKKLVKGFIKHDGNKHKAYAEAFPNASRTTIKGNAHNTFKAFPALEQEAKTLLEASLIKEGMSLPALAKGLKGVIDNPTTERQTQSGGVISLVDNNLKLKALSKAFDLHTGNNAQQSSTVNNIQVNISGDAPDKLDGILNSLDAMSKKLGISQDAQDGEIVDVDSSALD